MITVTREDVLANMQDVIVKTVVEFDKPLNRSDQPQPTIKLTEVQDNTKPACDG